MSWFDRVKMYYEFPSLIGRLKPSVTATPYTYIILVSIPHR